MYKKFKIEIKWAIIFSLMTIAWMMLEKFTGLHGKYIDKQLMYTNLFAVPSIIIYALAMLNKKKNDYQEVMTFKQGFTCGLIITMIITILSPSIQYINSTFISPEYFPNIIKYAVSSGNLSEAEATDYFNLKNFMLQGLISTPLMGLITNAILAGLIRSKSEG